MLVFVEHQAVQPFVCSSLHFECMDYYKTININIYIIISKLFLVVPVFVFDTDDACALC